MQGAFAFLDLLGFSEYTKTDLVGAARLLESQRTILTTRLADANWYRDHGTPVNAFASARLATSFDHFLPFSDSICIASSDPNLFLRQLAAFLTNAFLYTGHAYAYRDNPENPTAIDVPVFGASGITQETQNWFPALWRGGLGYGRVEVFGSHGLVDKTLCALPLLIGEPVLEAVALEKSNRRGPRLFCRPGFKHNISDGLLQPFFVPAEGGDCEEFLWTGCNYNDTGKFEIEFGTIHELLEPAIALWEAKRGTNVEGHYWAFVLLVVRGALKWAETRQRLTDARDLLRHQLIAFRHETDADRILTEAAINQGA
jgi:hypothetical protein